MGWKTGYLRAVNSVRNAFTSSKLEHWQDPSVVYVNTIDHHTPLRLLDETRDVFNSVREPKGETGHSIFIAHSDNPIQCRFKLYPDPFSVPVATATVDSEYDADWELTPLPSNWQMVSKGDIPIYTNFSFPWKRGSGLSTSVPRTNNPTGCYRVPFTVPKEWLKDSHDIFLILHGAGSGVDIFINSIRVAYGQDSMTETETCISTADLKEGENLLTMIVYRWTDGSYFEDQDQWWLSGVFRDIELQCRPKAGGILDYIVNTDMQDNKGVVSLTVKTIPGGTYLRAEILDAGKKVVASVSELALDSEQVSIDLNVPSPICWNTQSPYLYTLALTVTDENGGVVQVEGCQVGIRVVKIIDGQICVNNEPILVCGVNRHEWNPVGGKVMTEELMQQDIKLMKQLNFNAVRNCHYPNVHRWYELCDQYGMFVVDEANIETHGFTKAAHISILQCNPRWTQTYMTRIQAMVKRSRNHACIIGWSLGNESGCGPNMKLCADWIRETDPSRPVQYEGGSYNGDSPMLLGDGRDPYCTDIICPMYDGPLDIANVIEAEKPRIRPLVLCEYAHAMGNSSGGLHLYFKLFRSKDHPLLQGGFIWDFVDQGLSLPDHNDGHWGYGGDFGSESGADDKTFCINGMVFPDRTPHPGCFEAKYLQQPITFLFDGTKNSRKSGDNYRVNIELFSHCPPLAELDFSWDIRSSVAQGTISNGNCKVNKLTSRTFELELVKALAEARAISDKDQTSGLFLRVLARFKGETAWAEKGHILAEEMFELQNDGLGVPFDVPLPTSGMDIVSLSEDVIAIETRTYRAVFNKKNGHLLSFLPSSDIQELQRPEGMLKSSFFRAPIDNDMGGAEAMLPYAAMRAIASKMKQEVISYNGQWHKLGLDQLISKTTSVNVDVQNTKGGEKAILSVEQEFCHNKSVRFKTHTCYSFHSTSLSVDVSVEASNSTLSGTMSIPRIGTEIVLPGHYEQVRYLGCGPFECYPDRKAGAKMGVYTESNVDDMHVPYIWPGECGGRSDCQWVEMRSKQSKKAIRIEYAMPENFEVREEYFPGMDLSESEPAPAARPSGMRGAQFNASRYTVEELQAAKHQYELPNVNGDTPIKLHIDTAHMGIGGDVSWMPRLHKQYRVHAKTWDYRIRLSVTD